MEKLLGNAIDSIEVGMQDFWNGSDRRLVSAVRNVYAGLLLLAKAVLWNESPGNDGSLVFITKVKKDGTIIRTGKTVDVKGIQDRFVEIGLSPDWGPLDALQSYRNDIEHLFSSADPNVVKEQLGRTLPLIQKLMGEYLGIDPRRQFSDDCWQALLETEHFFNELQAACAATFDNIDWESTEVPFPKTDMSCPNCGSHLIWQEHPDQRNAQHMHLICRNCGTEPDLEDCIEQALADSTAAARYLVMTDGDRAPIETCLSCGREAFIVDIGKCILCDFEIGGECAICGEHLSVQDYSPEYPDFCEYHAHVISKDD
ncbi:hypothetical protein [Rhizobium tumorigenes]|uniref:Uncharacterized protein n=1 Tax=Rhizobium tumorigenes TaxID=2041385 RepID=A0AAF1KB66_9HYPH|nr:hypothetical protein [Rhizobium tumorigenes]WFR96111.1 hypothetical protein PR017_02885 [Rhizobium tumorigenes]